MFFYSLQPELNFGYSLWHSFYISFLYSHIL